MDQANRYPVEVHWSDEDEAFVAAVYDLPGCLADGPTEAQALAAAHEAAADWIAVATEEGRNIPRPSSDEPASGKFVLRMPSSLHRELRERARREGVTLNTLVVTLLAQREAETRPQMLAARPPALPPMLQPELPRERAERETMERIFSHVPSYAPVPRTLDDEDDEPLPPAPAASASGRVAGEAIRLWHRLANYGGQLPGIHR